MLRNTETGPKNATETNASGAYSFPCVRPSQYVLSVEAPGFRRVKVPAFTINESQTLVQDVALSVGQIGEAVIQNGGLRTSA